MGATAIFAAQILRLTYSTGSRLASVIEFMKLRKNERALKRPQSRNHRFAVAVPAKLIVIDLLAVFAKVVFDRLEKTISRLETSHRKFPPLCGDCACHRITTIRTLRTAPIEFFARRKSSPLRPSGAFAMKPGTSAIESDAVQSLRSPRRPATELCGSCFVASSALQAPLRRAKSGLR